MRLSPQKYEYVRSGQLWSHRKIPVLSADQRPDRSPAPVPSRKSHPTQTTSASSNRMTAFVNPVAEMPDRHRGRSDEVTVAWRRMSHRVKCQRSAY